MGCTILFLFFGQNDLSAEKYNALGVICALLCGLFGYFFTGSFHFVSKGHFSTWGKVGIKAGGGAAAFVFVLMWWHSNTNPIHKSDALDKTATQMRLDQLKLILNRPPDGAYTKEARQDAFFEFVQTERTRLKANKRYSRVEVPGAQLQGLMLSAVDLTNVDFGQANLNNTIFTGTPGGPMHLSDSKFVSAQLEKTSFTMCDMYRCEFGFCRLQSTSFLDCILRDSTFVGAEASDLTFDECDLRNVSFLSFRYDKVAFPRSNIPELRGVSQELTEIAVQSGAMSFSNQSEWISYLRTHPRVPKKASGLAVKILSRIGEQGGVGRSASQSDETNR